LLPVSADILGYQGSTTVSGWMSTPQTDLLPTEVSDPRFGQRYDHVVSGQVYAQPVIADDGSGRRVLVTATENNEVYGLHPDDGAAAALWHVTLAPPFVIAKNAELVNCIDLTPNVGITSTPVVDAATRTVYLTSKTTDPTDATGATARYFVHALSLVDGSEKPNWPVQITGTADNDPGTTFDATKELQRPGLLLMAGVVYMGFGGHCDTATYYGWVVGVGAVGSARATTITARWSDQKASDGSGAGIWMSGAGLASDGASQILLTTGNGTLPEATVATNPIPGNSPPANLGEAAVRLAVQSDGTLKATDFFSPSNNAALNANDLDIGSSGIAVLPDSFGTPQHPHVAVISGKEPILRSLDLANLGGFDKNTNHVMGEIDVAVDPSVKSGTWGRVAAWPGDEGWVYVVDASDPVPGGTRASGLVALQRSVDSAGNVQFVKRGTDPSSDGEWVRTSGSPTITSNGTAPMTAVVWAVQAAGYNLDQTQLRAFGPVPDANGNLPLLWTGPTLARGAKFTSVAVDNNHVYIGTRDSGTPPVAHVYGYWLSSVPDLSESPLWFGSQQVTSPKMLTASLAARIAGSVTVTGASSDDPHFVVGARTPPDHSAFSSPTTLQVPVTFTPTIAGDVRSTIHLTMGDGTTVSIGVGGTGFNGLAQLSTDTTAIDVGNHATGTTFTTSFQLRNTGGQPLILSSASISGVSAYTALGLPVSGTVMSAGATVPISVKYAPVNPTNGTPDTATVTVTSNAGNVSVTLTGTATPPGQLSVTPTSISAGDVVVGTAATLHFTVSNTGGTAISISTSKPLGGDFMPLTQLPEGSTLQPGVSKGIDVQFKPSVTGAQTATWDLNSDGLGGLISVQFTGNGVNPAGSATLPGYWLGAADGGVFTFGTVAYHGSKGDTRLNKPIVAMAATPDGAGYWLVASDGGVFCFGDAQYHGSTGDIQLNRPIVGMAVTHDGNGYWLVASDGGVFAFGSAPFWGTTATKRLNQPIVGIAATHDDNGYWLVASDGGIFSFGNAQFKGSMGGQRLNQPIVGMATTRDGSGYWLVATDGGIFSFGAPFFGSLGDRRLNAPILGMLPTRDGTGYWMIAGDGGVFTFGRAPFYGSTGDRRLNQPVVAMAA
jgi:hypothetical protein